LIPPITRLASTLDTKPDTSMPHRSAITIDHHERLTSKAPARLRLIGHGE
jgi:hypothetical protein